VIISTLASGAAIMVASVPPQYHVTAPAWLVLALGAADVLAALLAAVEAFIAPDKPGTPPAPPAP
jgi:hypothetical protein